MLGKALCESQGTSSGLGWEIRKGGGGGKSWEVRHGKAADREPGSSGW
jgi:hypothetical protein